MFEINIFGFILNKNKKEKIKNLQRDIALQKVAFDLHTRISKCLIINY